MTSLLATGRQQQTSWRCNSNIRAPDDFSARFGPSLIDYRPAADLRAAGGTVSYRRLSAPHKLAFQAAGTARVYALPPWNRLDRVAIHQQQVFHLQCQIQLSIAMTFNRPIGLRYVLILHQTVNYAKALLGDPAGMRLLYSAIQSRFADDHKMAAAKQERNQNMKLSTTLPRGAGVVHKQAVWARRDKVRASLPCEQ